MATYTLFAAAGQTSYVAPSGKVYAVAASGAVVVDANDVGPALASGFIWDPAAKTIIIGHGSGTITRNSDNATDTTLAVIAQIPIPAGLMLPNSIVRVWSAWNYTNSVSVKTLAPRFGTQSLGQAAPTTSSLQMISNMFFNNNSLTQQRIINSIAGLSANSSAALITTNTDTTIQSSDMVVAFACQWGANVAAEFISLINFSVELLR